MSGINNIQKGQPLNKEDAKTNEIKDSKVLVTKSGAITINVFFDGTGNNMFNTKARLEQQHPELTDQTSYDNYYSNIALLYMASAETATFKNIYIEGSGTFKYNKDDFNSLAFSVGQSGVNARVTEAFSKANTIRVDLNANKIIFNVFGFSRGAFYARYFCAMAKLTDEEIASEEQARQIYLDSLSHPKNYPQIIDPLSIPTRCLYSGRNRLDISSNKIRINFVGLYDTVSSHGLKHYNDVIPFELNIVAKQGIRKIVHLTAQNEYRNHFPLTHIDTAVADEIGFECSLPGAHSDIGGAYCDNWAETQYISNYHERTIAPQKEGEIHWKWFTDMGYYQGTPVFKPTIKPPKGITYPEQLIFRYRQIAKEVGTKEVFANRKFTSNSYQFIQLQIMKEITEIELATQFNNPKGNRILNKDIASIDNYPLLVKFRAYAKQYILDRYRNVGMDFSIDISKILTIDEQKQFYNQFIHNSLDPDSIANGSDSRNQGPQRIEIHDY